MVSPWIRDVLLYGAIALVAGALLVFYARDAPAQVPAATALGGRSHALRRAVVRVAPWPALVGGAIAAVWIYTQSHRVVIVTGDAGHLDAHRMVKLGAEPSPEDDTREPLPDPVWVLNEASAPLRVETVHYGQAFGADPAGVIPARSIAELGPIDYLGPDDPPPDKVTSDVGLGMETRTWLTWDR